MPKNDIETLKAWAHWKRRDIERNPDTFSDPEGELALVTAVENVISQVGTWKAKYEALKATLSPPIGGGSISWDASGKMVSQHVTSGDKND